MVPTIKEFIEQNHSNVFIDESSFEIITIEFTKLHVEAALKEASRDVSHKKTCENAHKCTVCKGDICENPIEYVNKKSILNAYPLTNIK